jgi:cytoskeletal protein RodZ
MATPKEIGMIFKKAREEKGISSSEAASRTRIHINVISDIENGVFDRMGSIYIKSFMKKYSDYLGLDTTDIIKLFESSSGSRPEKNFDVAIDGVRDDVKQESVPEKGRLMALAAVVILSIVLISLLWILIGMLKKGPSENTGRLSVPVAEKKAAPETKSSKSGGFSLFGRKEKKYSLTLEATDDVWLEIKSDGKNIFSGIIKKGRSKQFSLEEPVTIWTGKAQNMLVSIDGIKAGTVAKGVVKNIGISSDGVKVGSNWVYRTGE